MEKEFEKIVKLAQSERIILKMGFRDITLSDEKLEVVNKIRDSLKNDSDTVYRIEINKSHINKYLRNENLFKSFKIPKEAFYIFIHNPERKISLELLTKRLYEYADRNYTGNDLTLEYIYMHLQLYFCNKPIIYYKIPRFYKLEIFSYKPILDYDFLLYYDKLTNSSTNFSKMILGGDEVSLMHRSVTKDYCSELMK